MVSLVKGFLNCPQSSEDCGQFRNPYPCLIMVSLVKGFLNCPQSSEAQTEWGKLVHFTTENQLYAYMLNMSEVVFLRCPESSSMMGMRWTWERYWGGEGLCFFFALYSTLTCLNVFIVKF